jgi:hypothetical protein
MEATSVAAGITQRSEGLEETFGLPPTQRIIAGIGPALVRCPTWWQNRSGENLARLGNQGIEENRFGILVELIEIDPGAAKAFADSDFNPIGGTVTSAFEPFGIDESFDQSNGMTVDLLPILAQALEVQA